MIVVAEEAGVSPGLLHHHVDDEDEMLDALLTALRHPPLFRRVRALVDAELESTVARSSGRLDAHDAGA